MSESCLISDSSAEAIPSLNTAILFLLFNRADTTCQIFKAIRQAKPCRLYIAADGPRSNVENEKLKCEETRKIATAVDWQCEVRTLFREKNLGCRQAVSSAIDWFFENEEQGIILEDDCLPSQSFFWYCQELLEHYKNDERIMVIAGSNFQKGEKVTGHSYYFSRYNHCWGWAAWRRSWKFYDHEMSCWPEFRTEQGLRDVAGGSKLFVRYWQRIFDSVAAYEIDSWAYIWTFSCWAQRGLTCLPNVNLVRNIGFGEGATHTKNADSPFCIEAHEISLPLRHPELVFRHTVADKYTDRHHFLIKPLNLLVTVTKEKFPLFATVIRVVKSLL